MSERDILFHGKRVDNEEWVEGYYCLAVRWTGDKEPKPAIQDDYFIFHLVDPTTVGQYTGRTDRNGKRIFDGDIVEGPDFDAEDGYAVVHWDNDTARFTIDGECLTVDFDNYYGNDVEVIGNIYDDPELLERGRG